MPLRSFFPEDQWELHRLKTGDPTAQHQVNILFAQQELKYQQQLQQQHDSFDDEPKPIDADREYMIPPTPKNVAKHRWRSRPGILALMNEIC